MRKVFASASDALAGILRDGMTIASGGFGLCGLPERLLDAIQASYRFLERLTGHR